MSDNAFWRTSISKVEPDKILIRGYDLAKLVGKFSFAELTYLLWKGELPSQAHARTLDAILCSCIDHSLNAPSVDAARFVASSGVPLQAAVAAGVAGMGDFHGGAIEESAKMLQEGVRRANVEHLSDQEVANRIIDEHKTRRQRLAGFGHPIHTQDPRTQRLLDVAEETGVAGSHVRLARAIEDATERTYSKRLIINVDGAIAAIISDMGFDWRTGKGFFILSRTAGLVAHVYEQMYSEKPYKMADWKEIRYEGPPERPPPR